MTNTYPRLHNAAWPGVVGKGSADAEPFIDLDTMLDLTAKARVNGVKFDGVDLFLFAPHVDIDSSDDDLKRLADKVRSRNLAIGSVVAPVWPPTGIALAALLVLGSSVWPAIFVGAFLVNFTTTGELWSSVAIAVGNTLEGVVGAWLVHRYAGGRRAFERPQDVFRYVLLAGLVATLVSPMIGVTSLRLAGRVEWTEYGGNGTVMVTDHLTQEDMRFAAEMMVEYFHMTRPGSRATPADLAAHRERMDRWVAQGLPVAPAP